MRAAVVLVAAVAGVAPPGLIRAQGGPPLLTDDPGTPGDGRWEVNIAATAEKQAGSRRYEAPLLDINYGLGERLQLKLEAPWVILDEDGDDAKNGPGNTLLGVKWRFLDQETSWIDLSVYPQVEFNNPTSSADRGLVEEGTAWILPFQLEASLGAISVNPELGYVALEGEDEWLYGLALGSSLPVGLDLLAELHGEAESDLDDDVLVAQVGCRWVLHPQWVLLAAVGTGLRHRQDERLDLLAYVGLQVHFGLESRAGAESAAATGPEPTS